MSLMSKSDMATRWDVSRQVVNNWESRHSDFPPIHMKVDNDRMPLYLLEEVKKYEKKRGIKMTTWEFKNYAVYQEMDLLRFENNEGVILGYITITDESIEKLNEGANPIEERWEDGIGNTIHIDGWNEEEN